MISIQSAMLVALGFLAASLLALFVAPAFWTRAVRLTTVRIKNTMPLSEMEIRADKDRVRAEFAVKVHHLERKIEKVRLAAARQMVELNRRDARINGLDAQLEHLRADHEEVQNARRVLEQTIAERLPRVEGRLDEAKHLIHQRDREIGELSRTTDAQSRALGEAAGINAQQKSELERLGTALSTRGARRRDRLTDPQFDEEVALRAELEALRAKTRDQAQLLTRLQSLVGRTGFAGATASKPTNGSAAAPPSSSPPTLPADASEDSARMSALQTANDQMVETIHKLRSALALANEKARQQAEHFTSELKRLGAGSLPASGQPRRADASRLTLAERVAQARVNAANLDTATPAGDRPAPDSAAEQAGRFGATVETAVAPIIAEPQGGASVEPLPRPKQEAAPASANRPRLADRISGIGRSS